MGSEMIIMKKKMHYLDLKRFVCQFSLLFFLMLITPAFAVEVQMGDITRIQEINSNQLLGMGIVVGLPGSGDSTRLVLGRQALSNMLSRMEGVRLDPDQLQARNIAAVIVTADLPPFAKTGDRLDVFVSSMGDAKDLNNGTLIFARLQAGDGKVYATAQGRIVVTRPKGQRGGTLPPNGEIVSGGLVVRNLEVSLDDMDSITLRLNHPNYSTSSLIAKKINETFWNGMAEPVDSGTVKVEVPEAYYGGKLVNFIAAISELKIEPNTQATVVVDPKTGAVVIGEGVQISPFAVSLGTGQDGETPPTTINIIPVSSEGTTLADVVAALKSVGTKTEDLIEVLKLMEKAGALHATLIIM